MNLVKVLRRVRLGVYLPVVATVGLGCGDRGPCPGISTGMEFQIEVQGVNDFSALDPPCHSDWGLEEGTVLSGRVVRFATGRSGCQSGVPEFVGPDDWEWELSSDDATPGGRSLYGDYRVTREDCSARMELVLTTEDGFDCDAFGGDLCELQVFAEPLRGFESGCPRFCGILLDVRAETL